MAFPEAPWRALAGPGLVAGACGTQALRGEPAATRWGAPAMLSPPLPPPADRQVFLSPSAGTACHNPRPVASCHSLGRSPAVLVFLSALLPMSVAPRAGTSQPALDSRARGGCQGSARPRAHPSPSPHPRTGMAWRWADRCLRSPSLCDHIRPRGILVNCGLQGLILFQSPLY